MASELGNLPKCYGCHFFMIRDYGYSDWTVEETMVECYKEKFESRNKAYDFEQKKVEEESGYLAAAAMNCSDFRDGSPAYISVDGADAEIAEHFGEAAK